MGPSQAQGRRRLPDEEPFRVHRGRDCRLVRRDLPG
jgi:hypothetical protein